MADAEHLLDFFEGGVGMLFDMGAKFLRVELAPGSPARFRRQHTLFGGHQIAINGTPGQIKTPGSLDFGTTAPNEFHHPFPQVQRISFHACKLISICPNVNMKCYSICLGTVLLDKIGKLLHPELKPLIGNGAKNIEKA